ncbi:hypothetical protein H9P43_001523 [Blastocladiella emersonii ATCC 22665]|nr:hypothetical protein H9P43_001523 [Blastocladiella emersonii ATCC 22665]
MSHRVDCLFGLIDSPDFVTVAKRKLLELDDRSEGKVYERLREFFVATFVPYERQVAIDAIQRFFSLSPAGRSDAEFYLAFSAAILDTPAPYRMTDADAAGFFVKAVGRDRFPAGFDPEGWTLTETYAELCRHKCVLAHPPATDESDAEPEPDVAPASAVTSAEAESENSKAAETETSNEEPKLDAAAPDSTVAETTVESEAAGAVKPVDSEEQEELDENTTEVTAPPAIEPTSAPAASLDAETTTEPMPEATQELKSTRPLAKPVRSKKSRNKKKPTGPPPRPLQEARVPSPSPAATPQPAAAPTSSTTRLPIKPPGWRPAISDSFGIIESYTPGGADTPFVVGTINGTSVAARLVPLCGESFISSRVVELAGLTIDPSRKVSVQTADSPGALTLGVVYVYFEVGRHRIPLMLHVVKGMFWDIMYGRDGIASFRIVNGQFKFRALAESGDADVVVLRRKEIPQSMFDR